MIYFFADNHYGAHPGREQYTELQKHYEITCFEDNWSPMEDPHFADTCELLILNMIGSTCDIDHPSSAAEVQIKKYMEAGGNVLLLHGASAAFAEWDWWRPIVGHRWVRGNDPDGVKASHHPVRPYTLKRTKSKHPLVKKLVDVEIEIEDEIYMELQETCVTEILMQISTDQGTCAQVTTHTSPWGGTIHAFIPGHRPEVTRNPQMIANIRVLLDDLLVSTNPDQNMR